VRSVLFEQSFDLCCIPLLGERYATQVKTRNWMSKEAQLMTDELNVYTQADMSFASHETVEHGKGEYVIGNATLTKQKAASHY
jgi:hypothetical protein